MRRLFATVLVALIITSVIFAYNVPVRRLPGNIPSFGKVQQPKLQPQVQEKIREALKERVRNFLQNRAKLFEKVPAGYYLGLRLPADASLSEVKTFTGTVKEIYVEAKKGLVIVFETEEGTYKLANNFVWRQFGLKVGDQLEVTGRVLKVGEEQTIIPEKVKSGDKEIDLRKLLTERIEKRLEK
ncbi:hypothetical protein [Fervidobacterium thailandense]|uniref:Uncharacterized protein n=1 Tax=Fervidobacterium thailandense TaxID=1008305 RepID=A0A1E3G4U1_9BACT|nr:hypothetical protein [Fervidobacterium thailandense]ODN31311.1 hypothetical protein A4H02_00640 [Fervidobacterium thailandense]